MKNALITLAIGLSEEERASHGVFQSYARNHGLAFEVIDSAQFRIRPNLLKKRRVWYHIEKFQLFDALQRYERILFVDSDILIVPDCPDLFELVPEGSLGAVYDDTGPDAWKRMEELDRLADKMGLPVECERRYFNSGVMVLDRSLISLFQMRRKDFRSGRWPEQTLLNYRVLTQGIPVTELQECYNFLPHMQGWKSREKRLAARIIHYAGREAKICMAEDLPNVKSAWELREREVEGSDG